MIINLFVIFLILSIGFFFNVNYPQTFNESKIRKKYVYIICFIFIFYAGLRNLAVGDDTYQYYRLFEDIKTKNWDSINEVFFYYLDSGIGKDVGYLYFEKIIQIFTNEFQVYLFVVALIFFSSLGNFIYKNTTRLSDCILGFLIYFVLFNNVFTISAIRQSLALAVVFYAFELIKKKKFFIFIIILISTSLIHKTVLIFIPFYFIAQIKKERLFVLITIILFPLVFINRDSLGEYFKLISGYNDYEQYEGAGTYNFTLLFLFLLVISLFQRKFIINKNAQAKMYFLALGLVLVLLPMSWIHPAALRITMYFSIFILLLLPEVLNSLDKYSLKFKKDMYVLTVVLLVLLYMRSNWNNPIQYGFFWEEMTLGENYL